MKIKILEAFTGYPDGKDASRTDYAVGQEPDVPDTFGELVIGKGLAEAVDASVDAPVAAAPSARPGADLTS